MAYVSESVTLISSRTEFFTTLNLRQISAIGSLHLGNLTKPEADLLIEALNVTEAYCLLGLMPEYQPEVLNALSALNAVCVRSLAQDGKFICQGNELDLIDEGFKVHVLQLKKSTIGLHEKAVKLVLTTLRAKRAKVIQDA
tara:strand:- start:62 stop:484 length:423 start_codon:yes stop_codon:yes gene_type:complete